MPKELQDEFPRVFEGTEPACLTWAFREWRLSSPYLPAIADLAGLVERWRRAQREEAAEKLRLEEKAKLEAARERGELMAFSDMLRQLNEVMGKMPEPLHLRRVREMRSRQVRSIVPAVTLTTEQIAARRGQELEEIRRVEAGEEKTA